MLICITVHICNTVELRPHPHANMHIHPHLGLHHDRQLKDRAQDVLGQRQPQAHQAGHRLPRNAWYLFCAY